MSYNITHIKDCYGCGICSIICPKKIINIELNSDGFYEPVISNIDKCISCGLCLDVCSYTNKDVSVLPKYKIQGYAGWSNRKDVLNCCSSGGIGFELGEFLISKSYKACGVKYNYELDRAEHFITSDLNEYTQSIGSKYIPSYTLSGFSSFNDTDLFFVTGTPCQIDSIRRYIRKKHIEEHFILMDFFCHGVPSMRLWDKYIKYVRHTVGEFSYISWRNKTLGWQNSWIMTASKNNNVDKKENIYDFFSPRKNGDPFYQLFLGNSCLGKACYDHCKYKQTASAADIRIGDLWGNTYKSNNDGVSGIITFTEKGDKIISSLNNCTFEEQNLDIITEGQMNKGASKPKSYKFVKRMLKTNMQILSIAKINRLIYIVFNIPKILKHRLRLSIR